ncbi:MAG TPA: nucleoside hydrolase [Ktedonobacteraceae bacterium]|nr:nucleoside hydrolase [Ktedonobacteraceae bacterium]
MTSQRPDTLNTNIEPGHADRQKQLVFLDTDIGDDIDDALALALILQSSEIALQGVSTVFGKTPKRARLAAHLLRVFGREDVPVAAGIATPLQPRHRPSGVPQAAILDEREIFPALSPLSGPELLIQTTLSHQQQLTLICIGPLTNIATALNMEPCINSAIRNIVMMGGSGNVPWAEWNVRSDAKAAQIVLEAGIPVTMLGFDVTMHCQLRPYDLKQLQHANSPQTQLLSMLIAVWQRHRPRGHSHLPYLHDPLTIAALLRPELFRFQEMMVRVVTHGPFKGYMLPRMTSGLRVRAAVAVQSGQARNWIMQRLLTPVRL